MNNMKIIFLDIDGVLNANDDFGGKSKPNPSVQGYAGISRSKVRRLANIVEQTEAKIVLVSSWKNDYEEYIKYREDLIGKYLRNKLRQFNLNIYDTTLRYEQAYGADRGHGIKEYLKTRRVTDWIILDDEIFPDYDVEILAHLVKTEEEAGLTDSLATKAIQKLNQNN